jgi:hypothetical protein
MHRLMRDPRFDPEPSMAESIDSPLNCIRHISNSNVVSIGHGNRTQSYGTHISLSYFVLLGCVLEFPSATSTPVLEIKVPNTATTT